MQRTLLLSARQFFPFVLLTLRAEDRAGKTNTAVGLLCSIQTPNRTADG